MSELSLDSELTLFDKPIVAQSLSDLAFEKVVGAIVCGEIGSGERISEAHLARQFGISRGPLREALMRLEGRRLVERKLNLGAYVVELSERGLNELFTLREALEGMACRLAATAMPKSEILELSRYLHCHSHPGKSGAGPEYYKALEEFHVRIVKGSRNLRLIDACRDELYYQFQVYRFHSSVRASRAQAACDEHQAIIDALLARDPDRAEAAMRSHLVQVRANLIWTDEAKPKKSAA